MFGIGMSPSAAENTQYGNLTSASGFATGTGEADLNASSDFMRGILSGDSTKISQVLAPQIGAAKTSAQQQNKTNAAFGTRSGGTAASTAAANDKVHSDITSLIGELTGSSATSLSSTGSSLLSTGISGDQAAFGDADTLHQQNLAKLNDIFKSAASVAAAPFTGGASLTGLTSGSTPSGTPAAAPMTFGIPNWMKGSGTPSGGGGVSYGDDLSEIW